MFGATLRQARQSSGKSLRRFASELSFSPSMISRVESGQRNLDEASIVRAALLLGTPAVLLLIPALRDAGWPESASALENAINRGLLDD